MNIERRVSTCYDSGRRLYFFTSLNSRPVDRIPSIASSASHHGDHLVQTTVAHDRDLVKSESVSHTMSPSKDASARLESRHCQWTATFPASWISRSALRPIFMVCTVALGLSPATHSIHWRKMLNCSAVPLCPPVWRVGGIRRPITAEDYNDLHEFVGDPNNSRLCTSLSLCMQNPATHP
jgi:hypothetical protein